MSLPLLPFDAWVDGTDPEQPWNDNALRAAILGGVNVNNATTAQPSLTSPADDYKAYIIQSTHTGAQWATFTPKSVAIFVGGGWYEFTPVEGARISVGGAPYIYTSSAWSAAGGGGGSVAGSDKQIQFNDGGSMGAEAGFEYDKTSDTLSVVKLNEARGTAIASATTTDIGAASGNFVHVTGTTTITGFGTVAAGARRVVTFDGALTLTHNATSLILPGAANITTAAGDTAFCVSEGSGNWRVAIYQKANGQAVTGGSGSLANWTEAANTATPNATIPVVSFTATNAATDVDVAVVSKGAGAFARQIAANNTAGGNKRGARAVDLQASRSVADMVASAADSVIGGGSNNKASAANSTVAGGDGNTASNTGAVVSGGSSNSATATYAAVIGGASNSATGAQSAVVGGGTNTASGTYSLASGRNNTANASYSHAGGYGSSTKSIIGACVYSSYYNSSTVGKYQRGFYTFFARTTNATATAMTSDLAAASTNNQLILDNTSTYAVSGIVVARKASTNDYATWSFTACVTRDANAAATAVNAVTPVSIAASAGASSWVFSVSADTTNGGLRLTVTGAASSTISWTASVQTAEVYEP